MRKLAAGFLIACVAINAYGSGENTTYVLDWKNPAETLEYHVCGCADSCWVAEVKIKKTRALKARLRCDCEKLYVSAAPQKRSEFMQTVARPLRATIKTHQFNMQWS
jgi:hypothetical protein